MGLREDLKDPGLLFAVAGGLLGWSIIGGLLVYTYGPQWQYREQRLSQELDVTEVTYWADESYNRGIMLTLCPSFHETEKVWGEHPEFDVEIRINHLVLAFPEDLPSPEELGLAIDGNRFMIAGYRYEGIEENVLTGAKRQESHSSPRFDVVAWGVVVPYAQIDMSALGEDRPRLDGLTTPIAHKTAELTQPPEMFHELDDLGSGTCSRRTVNIPLPF